MRAKEEELSNEVVLSAALTATLLIASSSLLAHNASLFILEQNKASGKR
jgi:hypothetical protein